MMVAGSNADGRGTPAGSLGDLLREAAASWHQALATRDTSIRRLQSQLELVRTAQFHLLPVLMGVEQILTVTMIAASCPAFMPA